MLVKPEQYKGISFVRISSLPVDQKTKIRKSYSRESIVKILKDNSLINDCIIYNDYVEWYNSTEKSDREEKSQTLVSQIETLELVKE